MPYTETKFRICFVLFVFPLCADQIDAEMCKAIVAKHFILPSLVRIESGETREEHTLNGACNLWM